jgi:hypothetical protein
VAQTLVSAAPRLISALGLSDPHESLPPPSTHEEPPAALRIGIRHT